MIDSFKVPQIRIQALWSQWLKLKLRIGRSITELSILKPALFFSSILLFHVFYAKIVNFIECNLLISHDFSNYWLDLLIIVYTISTIIFFGFRFWYTTYKPSFSTIFLLFIVSYVISNFILQSDTLGWSFYRDSIFKIYYVFYFIFPAILLLAYYLFKVLILLFHKETKYQSRFLSDEPISKKYDDRLGYQPYVDNLSRLLLNESFPKSFSIALVGPWGNGKSSILDLVKNEFQTNENHLRTNLFIHFFPYLNHNEEDIIKEFFVLLSNQLSKFDGTISNQILKYSQKITDLYHSKSLIDFVSKPSTSLNNQAAKELYDDINESLTRINKKIIVFIDDLDRLSGNEIIQVLKLIRNTANFKNTIFVLAMDKDYVLQRLKSSNQILNSSYLEKFFQLEIYLPEIDKNLLRDSFLKAFGTETDMDKTDFASKIKNALLNSNLLFDDYVKNLRDVKRYTNQIKFDYPFIQNEIGLVDFINFTFLKTRFPSIVTQLYNDRANLLYFDSQKDIYYIEDLPESGQEVSNVKIPFDLSAIFDNQNPTSRTIETKDLGDFKKYKIFNSIIQDKKCFDSSNKVDCDDLYLLLKTLYTLFGKKDVEHSDSIQISDNLNILFYRKIQTHNFTKNDFEELLSFKNPENLKSIIINLWSSQKLPQFLKKLQWFEPSDLAQLKKIILILLHLYQEKNNLNINEIEVDKRLAINAGLLLQKEYEVVQKNSEWLWENIFGNNYLTLSKQIFLLGDLWDSQHENNLWGFEKEKIAAKAVELFKKHLINVKDKIWAVDDFDFYRIYHSLKNIDGVQPEINKLFISFWKKRNIELLCAQILQPAAFSYTAFNISDVLIEIFGSKDNFVEFVKKHKFVVKDPIHEYIRFLVLLQKTNFKIALDFQFIKSKLVKNRIKDIELNYKKNTIYDELEGISQVLFESNDTDLFRRYVPFHNTNNNLLVLDHKDYSIMRANIRQNTFRKDLSELVRNICKTANSTEWIIDSFDEQKLLKNESFLTHKIDPKKYIKIIHPNPLSNNA